MKNKKTTWYCPFCGYSETNHKQIDAALCPKCKGFLVPK